MQRSRLKNIINKSKEILNKPVREPFDEFKNSLPKGLVVGDNYRLEAAWKAYGSPKDFKQAIWEGMIQPISEDEFKLPSIGYNEETEEYEYLNKGRENDTVAKDIRVWDNDVIPFVQELKHGGYVRTFNEAKDCWTYIKNSQKENSLGEDNSSVSQEAGGEVIDSFQKGGKNKEKSELEIRGKLLKEWPVISNIQFHLVPDSTFTSDKTGMGSIEYFAPDEEDEMLYPNGYKYKNPYKGEASIVYDPNTNNYEDIKMDLLHALRVQDPKYGELVKELDNIALGENGDISRNARQRYNEDYKKLGKEYMPFKRYISNEVDGLLRNLFYNASPNELRKKRYYPYKEDLKKWNEHLLPYIQRIEQYLKGPQAFKQGGQMTVIPEGALHARKNNMEGAGDKFTAKGIPVMDNGGEQQAEIERNEIIFRKEITDKIESLYKKFNEEESPSKKDDIAIEMGKIITCEITKHTEDRTGLIQEVEQKM